MIWLIIFAPLTCSYHGFLLRPGGVPAMADMSMSMENMGMGEVHMQHDGRGAVTLPRSGLNAAMAGHHTSEGETAMLSLLMLAAPALYQLEPPAHSHARFFELPAAALHPWPPPERPPRTA